MPPVAAVSRAGQALSPEEMGRFLLGSTIVMLFTPGTIEFNRDWAPERHVRLGEKMGNRPA